MATGVSDVWRADGFLGLVERSVAYARKKLFTVYYRLRFMKFGRNSVVTGPVSVWGGRHIEVGENVVIEAEASLRAVKGGRIIIGDGGFIEKGARLIAEGELILGKKVYVLKDAQITSVGRVTLGNDVWVARGSAIGGKEVVLEDDVILGPHVSVMDGDHYVEPETGRITMHAGARRPICIKENSWVGARAIVLKGVTIGEGSIVGAGSVVTKDIPAHCVAVGVPAEPKKNISYQKQKDDIQPSALL